MQSTIQDILYALRIARQNIGSTLAAFFALAFGIAAATTMFGILHGVILRPIAIRDPDRVVRIFESELRSARDTVSMQDFVDWRDHLKSFEGMALYRMGQGNVTGAGDAVRVLTFEADSALLPLVGIQPILGRNFLPEENQPGHNREAILSWTFWQNHFGGQNVVGKTILLDDKPHLIVGVLPAGFTALGERDVWVPLVFDLKYIGNHRGFHSYFVVARLRPNVSLQQANSELATMAAAFAQQYPTENKGVGASAVLLSNVLTGEARPFVLLFFGAVVCILLLACGNVANLLLVRSSARQREMSVRAAMGASPGRLFRQLLTESLALSIGASLAGLALAAAVIRLLRSLKSSRIPHPEQITFDWQIALFAVAAGIATGVLFGLVPALRARPSRLAETLKQASARLTGTKGQHLVRSALAFVEIALATTLLIVSTLLLKSFANASSVSPGFRTDHILVESFSIPTARYHQDGHVAAFCTSALEAIRSIPGVQNAAFTANVPLLGSMGGGPIMIEGKPLPKAVWQLAFAQFTPVTPDYFSTVGISLRSGRLFTAHDRDHQPPICIVNEALKRQFFGSEEPAGHRLSFAGDPPHWCPIVGVVSDARQRGLEKEVIPEVFIPLPQAEEPWLSLIVRTAGDPLSYLPVIRKKMRELDPALPAFHEQSMDQVLATQMGWRVFHTSVLSGFAAFAILLASVGIYAVVAYSVSQRTSEIGLRMAFGASREDILRSVLREGIIPGVLGAAAGCAAAGLLARYLSKLLYQVRPIDWPTYLSVALLLVAIALAASYLPARRASAVDPVTALRSE